MTIFMRIIIVFWFLFVVYWFVSGLGAKKSSRTPGWWQAIWFRVAFIAIFFLVIHVPLFVSIGRSYYASSLPTNPILGTIGIVLCGLGILFAVWARIHLGRNWGMPMTLQEDHKLVVSGPYAYVRHPIYTGFLLAMLGTTFVAGIACVLILIAAGVYFIYSGKMEEKIMLRQFPNDYPAYMKKTKMLIPFVL